ncbi:MAG: LytTR family transcriptional regulator, partial [Oscillospiraceae bacterium]|nr:LytTR family transcriptional regulator [Oscillospiraceae bacterium]
KQRLYELEELLPPHFVRISKSAIANTRHIFSINRNLAASSLVQFNRSHKQAYVSRKYYPALRQKLDRK